MRSLSASQGISPLSLFHFLHFYTCILIIPISCNSPNEPIRKGIVPPIEPHKDSVRFSIHHESSIGNQRNDSSQTLLSHCSISFSLFHLVFFRIMAFSGSHLFFSDFFIIARWRTVIFCGKGICWIALYLIIRWLLSTGKSQNDWKKVNLSRMPLTRSSSSSFPRSNCPITNHPSLLQKESLSIQIKHVRTS